MAATPPVPSAAVQVATVFAAPGMIVGDMIGSSMHHHHGDFGGGGGGGDFGGGALSAPSTVGATLPTFHDRTVLLPPVSEREIVKPRSPSDFGADTGGF